ncbi:aldolase [Pseudonocardia acaciae]|uniref:RraA family protein n=1 Tax=Pseudonocardia acaciae TaxID=551276 RepID=UPI00048E7078|nr:aldolase [Pseudonocardia acaciae]
MFLDVQVDNIAVAGHWERPDPRVLERFADVPAANVGDALERMSVLDGGVGLRTRRDRLVGFALPVDVRSGDNLAIHRALDEARPGDVLVVNGRGDTTRALIGDLIGEIMISAGMVGAVVDGAVRDVDALSRQGLTVYARAVTPAGPFKDGPGSVGGPVAVGGVVVAPGDLIVGDADGVVVVPTAKIEQVSERVGRVVGNEEALRARILEARARR